MKKHTVFMSSFIAAEYPSELFRLNLFKVKYMQKVILRKTDLCKSSLTL